MGKQRRTKQSSFSELGYALQAKGGRGCGLRCAIEMNKVLLASLGWRLLNEKEALWSRTLVSKYGRGRSGFSIFEHKNGSIHIWRGMLIALMC